MQMIEMDNGKSSEKPKWHFPEWLGNLEIPDEYKLKKEKEDWVVVGEWCPLILGKHFLTIKKCSSPINAT